VTVQGAGEIRICVRAADATEGARLIESYRQESPAPPRRLREEFAPLEERIGYQFRDPGLLEHALTHRSRAHEDVSGGVVDNESLEFLGDAILGFLIADMLFREFPEHREGQKSKIKAWVVSTPSLARLGEGIGLGEWLLLGRGEEKTGGRRKQALIADSYEALIAAVYLDGGLEPVRRFVHREFRSLLDEARRSVGLTAFTMDYKSALQELAQGRELPLPEYALTAERGPDHQKTFEVEVRVQGKPIARAEGRTKKEAEQHAAARALEILRV
jgi:ribonuclease III